MVELCNCPMLDSITPLMSWSNTPIGTPRRTPLPTPHGTPLITPRATPRCTPRGTPRATPTPMSRIGYNPGEYRSPSRTSMLRDDDAPPPRRRFVQAPEIFSSFSSKQVHFHKESPIFATKKKVDEGSTAELKCFISCAPLTTTTWEKDGMPLLSNNLISLSEKTGVVVTLSLDLIPDIFVLMHTLQEKNDFHGRSPNDAAPLREARGLRDLPDDHHQLLRHRVMLGIALC